MERWPPAPAGSFPRSTSSASVTTASRGRQSGPVPTSSSPSRRAWSWCWRPTSSMIAHTFECYWPAPVPSYDPQKARQLLAEAGYPNGFDAGDYYCDASYANLGEAVVNYLQRAGIRAQLRPLERAAFILQNSQKKLKNIIQTASGAFGNTATPLAPFVAGR